MADKRAFANLDVGYMQNPKLVALPFAMPNALLAHMQSVLYCAQHLTDGHAPEHLIRSLTNASESEGDHLVNIGLWHRPGHDCDDCPQPTDMHVYVHDYLEHNRSKAEVVAKSEAAKRGANARWNAERNAGSNAERNASSNAKKERKKEVNKPAPDSAEASDDFDKFWDVYPSKKDKGQARKAFKAALKKTSLDVIIEAAEAYAIAKAGSQYIKYPATWLNAEAWENDEAPEPQQTDNEPSPDLRDPWGRGPGFYRKADGWPITAEYRARNQQPPEEEFLVWPGNPATATDIATDQPVYHHAGDPSDLTRG